MAKQDDYQKTALRVPKDLHAKIIEAAKSNNRTMNAEIIERLSSTFPCHHKESGIETAIKEGIIESLNGLTKNHLKLIQSVIDEIKR